MLKIENTEVMGWEHAIRGMRNPKNSWEKSDSGYCDAIGDKFGDVINPIIIVLVPFAMPAPITVSSCG